MDRTMIEKRLKFHTERLDNLYAAYNALVNSRAKSYRLDDRELTRFDLDTLSDEIEDAERKVEELTALLYARMKAAGDFCDPAKPDWGYPGKLDWKQVVQVNP